MNKTLNSAKLDRTALNERVWTLGLGWQLLIIRHFNKLEQSMGY